MSIETIFKALQETNHVTVRGLRGSSPSWLTAVLAEQYNICCIVPDEYQATLFSEDLTLFTSQDLLLYPAHEIPPYTPLSPDQKVSARRISTLYQLLDKGGGIFISSIEALLRRILPPTVLTVHSEYLMANESCDREDLITKLPYLGYEQVGLVQTVGDFSVRGGIVDIYPPEFCIDGQKLHDGPIRLDFFGDTIESIRSFDPYSQRSIDELSEATLLPIYEILFDLNEPHITKKLARQLENLGEEYNWDSMETARIAGLVSTGQRFAGMESLLPVFYNHLDYKKPTVFECFPKDTLFILLDPEGIYSATDLIYERIHANFQETLQKHNPSLPPTDLFMVQNEVTQHLDKVKQLHISDFESPQTTTITLPSNNHRLLQQDISLKRSQFGLLAPLNNKILEWQKNNDQIVLCCRSTKHAKNLAELLTKHQQKIRPQTTPVRLEDLDSLPNEQELFICDHPLSRGFSLKHHKVHILSESELFGEMRLGKKTKKARKEEPLLFSELTEGDIVVHRDHGLGVYKGLSTIELNTVINDFMLLEYRDGDKLYLPVDRLNQITRYQGLSDRSPKIDKLGSQSWKAVKSKVKEEVWRVAQELLTIYAKREIKEGHQFSAPGSLYHELEESFAYDETPGQDQAISDVLQDLTSDKPMDRLVCGDVGYGKTEVAVRAAFKVVEDGHQVAILVPTTVLAEQHAKTFLERFKGFPVNIEAINRFRSTTEQKKIIKKLETGSINIIIGTHRLLSKDVAFNNLGLVIIDEEHRFGVTHKEKLKKMRTEVDILTLTATPIPRTLQMSLLSIRDLSVISTPPEHRQPVKTFVSRYDDLVIKEAVSQELRRKGQVFFVHNRVQSIHRIARLIQELVPDARIGVAHGQMAGKDLEKIMVSFIRKEIDVLVSTTIIESGLDIPSANTIIINRADMLGLAEIYQLRGRVGRSSIQSYAYLLVPSLNSLSKNSKERLRALMDYSELGGGFKLAMSDLQIRGGGNLLGVSQSGNIAAIGYDLYLDLLQKTVADLKAKQDSGVHLNDKDDLDPEVHLQLSAYIPEKYIPDVNQRYITYRKIASLGSTEPKQLENLKEELKDRYGAIPAETLTLLRIVQLKRQLIALRINKIEQGKNSMVFSFLDDTPINPQHLMKFLHDNNKKKNSSPIKLTQDGRMILTSKFSSVEHIFETIQDTIHALDKLA